MMLAGKTALITGATGVIGGAIARVFAQAGCRLVVSGQSVEKLSGLEQALTQEGGDVLAFQADVSAKDSVRKLMHLAQEQFGVLDILVTAAGSFGAIGPLETLEPEDWMRAININMLGTMMTIKYALPLLKKSAHGKIVTFAGGGEGPMKNFSSYVSSKGAILRFTETLAQELAPYHIDINAISPGLVNSGLIEEIIAAGPKKVGKEKYEQAVREAAGEGNAVSPEKAAALAVFLASEQSHGLSGKNISAVWDTWEDIPMHRDEIMQSDIYTLRRIKPKDRGYGW